MAFFSYLPWVPPSCPPSHTGFFFDPGTNNQPGQVQELDANVIVVDHPRDAGQCGEPTKGARSQKGRDRLILGCPQGDSYRIS